MPNTPWISYKLFHVDTLIHYGDLNGFPYFRDPDITPGSKYALEIQFTKYMISDSPGTATARLEFDLSRPDPDPPTLQSLWVLSNGIPSDEYFPSDTGGIQFKCVDGSSGIDSVEAFFRPFGGEESWSFTPIIQQGDHYVVYNLPGMPEGYTSMRLRITDYSGNALDYQVEPAFVYHSMILRPPTCLLPARGGTDLPTLLNLVWNRPSQTTYSYHLQVASDSTFTHCLVDDSLLTKLSQRIGVLEKGTQYYWHVSAKNILGESSYSETWSFTTSSDTTFILPFIQNWNLVSMPVHLKNNVKENIFPTAPSDAFAYVGQQYQMVDTLKNGCGYWLKFEKNDTIGIAGKLFDSDTIEVEPGWNMIGSVSTSISVNGILSEPSGMITSSFLGFTSSYNPVDSLKPGCGYWVKVEQAGKLILSRSESISKLKRIRIVATKEMPPPPPGEQLKFVKEIPKEYLLEQNYPNPFNPVASFRYELPCESKVKLSIYNLLGQVVALLKDEEEQAGYKEIQWNANRVAGGVYFYRLEATSVSDPNKSFMQVKKMLLLK
jgi:hypothetical protein